MKDLVLSMVILMIMNLMSKVTVNGKLNNEREIYSEASKRNSRGKN